MVAHFVRNFLPAGKKRGVLSNLKLFRDAFPGFVYRGKQERNCCYQHRRKNILLSRNVRRNIAFATLDTIEKKYTMITLSQFAKPSHRSLSSAHPQLNEHAPALLL